MLKIGLGDHNYFRIYTGSDHNLLFFSHWVGGIRDEQPSFCTVHRPRYRDPMSLSLFACVGVVLMLSARLLVPVCCLRLMPNSVTLLMSQALFRFHEY
jgi:hypothetical protein